MKMKLIFLLILSIIWQSQCFASENIIKTLQSNYDVSRLEFSISLLQQSIQRKIDETYFGSNDPDRRVSISYRQGDTLTETRPSLTIFVSIECDIHMDECSADYPIEHYADLVAKDVYAQLGHFGDPTRLNMSGNNMFHQELGRRFTSPFSMDFYIESAEATLQKDKAIFIGSELAKILKVIVGVQVYKPRREVVFDYKVNIKPGSGGWFDDTNRVRREF